VCSSCERGVRICERNSSADTNVGGEARGGGAPGTGTEIPLQPAEKTMVRQVVLLEKMSTLQPVEDSMLEQVDMP